MNKENRSVHFSPETRSVQPGPKTRSVQPGPETITVKSRPKASGTGFGGIRVRTIGCILLFTTVFISILVIGSRIVEDDLLVDLNNIFTAPSLQHFFGTDWVGRDMLQRTLKGMSISMQVGLISTVLSVVIAMFFGVMAPVFGGVPDHLVSWLIDFVMSVPHTILIILISLACGGGLRGVVAGVVCTHWTSLTRVIRAEVLQLKNAEYVQIAEKLGRSRWYIAVHHMFPAILPQLAVGAVLLFPHAILHEASITFLGFGLPAHEPAIGVILSESMKYLTVGKWWLALFPGISLVAVTVMVEAIGKNLEKLISPHAAHL